MANDYRPPEQNISYNEFVGDLRPASDRAFTELHVRYGVRNNRYLDWSISLNARLGDLEEFIESGTQLERRPLVRTEVRDSAIRRLTFNPYEPESPPEERIITSLAAGDGAVVDEKFVAQLRGLAFSWREKHGAGVEQDRHCEAVFGFAAQNRNPNFRDGALSWVRNTLICLEDDLADQILSERSLYYFPDTPTTAGVLRASGRMQFIIANHKGNLTEDEVQASQGDTSDNEVTQAIGANTMGMLVDSVYSQDWTGEVEDFLAGQ